MRNLENSFSQKCVRFLDGLKSLILRIAHWLGRTAGIWITLLIVVGAYLLSGIVYKQVRGAVGAAVYEQSAADNWLPAESGIVITERFTSNLAQMTSFCIPTEIASETPSGTIWVRFRDAAGQLLAERNFEVAEFTDGRLDVVLPAVISEVRGQTFQMEIDLTEWTDAADLRFALTENPTPEAELTVHGIVLPEAICVSETGFVSGKRMQAQVLVIFGLLAAAALLTYWCGVHPRKKGKAWSLEKLFVPVFLLVGMAYVLALPVGNAPDEVKRFNTAYYMSDWMMGHKTADDGLIYVRADDADYLQLKDPTDPAPTVGSSYFAVSWSSLFRKSGNTELIETDPSIWRLRPETLAENKLMFPAYVPAAIGVTVGRLMGWNLPTLYVFGRMATLVMFVILAGLALRLMPFAKALMFAVLFLPITLQQAGAINYDSLTIALSMLVTALTLRIAYVESVQKKHVIGLILACLFLLPQKRFGVFPMVLLPVLIFGRMYRKYPKMAAGIVVALILGALCCIAGVIVLREPLANAIWRPHTIRQNDLPGFHLSYFAGNWGGLRDFMWNSLMRSSVWISELFGAQLGSLNIRPSLIVQVPFLFLLLYATRKRQDEAVFVGPLAKTWLFGIGTMTNLVSIAAMVFFWTTETALIAEGVQGRYFLPGLVAVLLVVRGGKRQMSASGEQKMALYLVLAQLTLMTGALTWYMF